MPEKDGAGRGRAISLDELIALNDEIVALTRSGMPLERGLVIAGGDLPGRLGAVAKALGERMARGESLPEALETLGDGVPRVYRSVVTAGIRSGRLGTALEGLATFARGYSEARRTIGLALWYPILVMTLAYALFLFLVAVVIPRYTDAFASLGLPVHAVLGTLGWLGESVGYWAPALPLVLLVGLVAWVASRRAVSLDRGRGYDFLRWFPWMGRMIRGFEAAGFSELTALLIDHQVPYPEALRLAGEASGDRRIADSSADLAGAIERGQSPTEALAGSSAFPGLLRWVLATGPSQGNLALSLRQMAERYRLDARFQGEKLRVFLPLVLLFTVGASSTLLYSLAIFLPMADLWSSVANQVR